MEVSDCEDEPQRKKARSSNYGNEENEKIHSLKEENDRL